jgi:peptide/nickel transport system substrate-binding protein
VKVSVERYTGTNAALLREKITAVEGVGPYRVQFHLTEPWPDCLAYHGTPVFATADA